MPRKCPILVVDPNDEHNSLPCGDEAPHVEVWRCGGLEALVWLCHNHHENLQEDYQRHIRERSYQREPPGEGKRMEDNFQEIPDFVQRLMKADWTREEAEEEWNRIQEDDEDGY